jgi:hypothetical protein
MSRQTGKTYLASVLIACYVLCGLECIIAFPTLKSGKQILLREIESRLMELQRFYPNLLKFKKNNQEGIECVNGGRIIVLTTNKGSSTNQGYSAALILIDEAHEADESFWNKVFPSTFAQSNVKILLLGIGGYYNSLIHVMKQRGFAELKMDGEFIASLYLPYLSKIKEAETFFGGKHTDGYQSNILCEDILSGQKMMFEPIPKALSLDVSYRNARPVPYAGIDVGMSGDDTVVTILYSYAIGYEVVDSLKLKGRDWDYQAQEIVKFLRRYNIPEPYTMIENNSIGQALLLALSKYSFAYNNIFIGKNKHHLVSFAQRLVLEKELSIIPDEYRNELEHLTLKVDDDGNVEYEHSDVLSSLIVALANVVFA